MDSLSESSEHSHGSTCLAQVILKTVFLTSRSTALLMSEAYTTDQVKSAVKSNVPAVIN